MLQTLLDFFFPRISLGGLHGAWITENEWAQMRVHARMLKSDELRAVGIVYLDSLVAAARYDDSPFLQKALRQFKYGGVRDLAGELGSLLLDASRLLDLHDAVFNPVPLFWKRNFQRGFNQSLLLSVKVSSATHRPLVQFLRRVRSTGQQAKRTRVERMAAMKDAFAVTSAVLPDHIILVDDVATTGATLDACAHALKNAGVRRVDALVVALG
jgi:ComF family protein